MVYEIIDKFYGDSLFYAPLIKLFRSVTFRTEIGQLMDLHTKYEHFTEEKYVEQW